MRIPADGIRLCLLGGFRLVRGDREIAVRPSGRRLLAFLALRPGAERDAVGWRLWIDQTEDHARASLRSTLWRLPRPSGEALVRSVQGQLRLSSGVAIDVSEQRASLGPESLFESSAVEGRLLRELTLELLPGWYDDWLAVERERHRQFRLHALETIADGLVKEGRAAEAIEVGLCAVEGEPLRESAHRCVIRAHIAEGNVGEAVRQAQSYLRALSDAGIPEYISPEMETLLGPTRSVIEV
jgi:DNA-binding SARP family transcriptional activator